MQDISPYKTANTQLTQAAKDGDKAKLLLLLTDTNINVNSIDTSGMTPLHWAALCNHTDIAIILIAYHAWVNACDNIQQTPLHKATSEGCLPMVELLISSYANVNARDKYNCLPVLYAIINGSLAVVKALVGAKAEIDDNILKQAEIKGEHSITSILVATAATIQDIELLLDNCIDEGDIKYIGEISSE